MRSWPRGRETTQPCPCVPRPSRLSRFARIRVESRATVARLIDVGAANREFAREISRFLDELAPHVVTADHERCFVHNDLHDMNVMCTPTGALLAVIDWETPGGVIPLSTSWGCR